MPFRATSRASVIANAIRPSLVPRRVCLAEMPVWPPMEDMLMIQRIPARCCPARSSTPCPRSAVSGLPESIFHADPHAGNLMVQTQKHAPLTLVLLDWSQAGRLSAPLRLAPPMLTLSLLSSRRRANARDYSAGTIQNFCAYAKNLLTRFGNPCDVAFRSSGITRSPPTKTKKRRKEKHECYRYQKGNRGNVGNH